MLERVMVAKQSVVMVLFAATALVVSPVLAQPGRSAPPPGCSAWDAGLPSQWAPWGEKPAAVTAANSAADAAHATIAVSKKYAVSLVPAKDVHMAVETPDADPPPNAHKGILSLRIPSDGYYWIAASGGLWIDVVSGGAIVESTDHGPGPQCASIAKSVQFMLKAGDALIQLSDNRGAQ